jgi:hypothetical protein
MTYNLDTVRNEITALLLAWPELADDEVLREDMIEGSTAAPEFLSELLRKVAATDVLLTGTREYRREIDERVQRLKRRKEAFRQLIKKVMELAGTKRMERVEGTVTIKNGVPHTIITDLASIPVDFIRVVREPDLTKIKAAIKAGEFVPGAELSNAEPTLQIRI